MDASTFTKEPEQFKQMSACQKADGNCFLGQERVLKVEFMQQGTTIMSEVNCETLRKLRRALQKKKHGMLTSGVVFLYNNVSLHRAACTRALLKHFNLELFDHLPYSPDLAPSVYHLFAYLKNWLRSQCFNNNELTEGLKTWLSSHVAGFFDTGIQKLIP
jgi:histone-lysine N-methyltransferase SETMAR